MAQLNSALDYGSRGYRFESYRGHEKNPHTTVNQIVADFYFLYVSLNVSLIFKLLFNYFIFIYLVIFLKLNYGTI